MAKKTTPKKTPETLEQKKEPAMASGIPEDIGRKALELNPTLAAVYVSCDGYCFGNKSDAINHAKNLEDTSVVSVKKTK